MESTTQLPPDRIAVIEKIGEYERLGGEYFFCDVENDPPSKTLLPEDVDYLHRSLKFKVNGFLSRIVESFCKVYFKSEFSITVEGKENLKDIDGGAIFTSNHFAPTENLAVKIAAQNAKGRHRMYKIVREGNYFMPGIIGWLLKYCDTLPLSSAPSTMKLLDRAIGKILKNDDFILFYPEQAMWWNYQKPRPHRIGAYHYAVKYDVPVVPCFVTLHRKDESKDMLPDNIRYTVHVMPPIYPPKDLKPKKAAEEMMLRNMVACKQTYETVYGKKLKYGE